ncbi:GGDEF domain-containing protein [Dielma fastidiosa]|uniref:GGDEF domain-containing protein n=1 Tax=Dielma fastidiosa TaxID=1034346 RepID=UPI000E484779|nr:GGDEF domain-containing protein [Dielma fastidiosa]RHM99536.1 GGDEF domain-containing protein [Dielma fastidiosa]
MTANYKSKKCEELVNKIKECRANNNIEGMSVHANELKMLAEDIQDTYSMTAALFYMSMVHFIKGEHDKTLSLNMEILSLCDLNDVPEYHVQTLNMMGIVYASISDFIAAISYLLKAYYFSLEHEELQYSYFPLNNIGALFQNLDIPDMALKYFLSSHEYKQKLQIAITGNDAIPVINIIAAYIKLNDFDEAKKWLQLYDKDYRQFESSAASIEVAIQRIHLYKHDMDLKSLTPLLDELVNLSEGIVNRNRYFKLLLEALEDCIELELKDYATRLLEELELMNEEVHDILLRQHLSGLKVKMTLKDYPDDDSYETLFQYYQKNENYRELEKSNTRQSLIIKIEQEEMMNEHRLILLNNARLLKNNELDPFTGIFNKAAFKQHVSEAVCDRSKDEYAALLMIDIDDFKNVNDTFGHYAGDQVILDVVGLLTKGNQSNVIAGRVGGDEFAVFFPSFYSLDYLYEKVENYLKAARKIIANDTAGIITISIGIYLTKQSEIYDEMFKKADNALYMAKRKGKNQYAVYAKPSDEDTHYASEAPLYSKSAEQFLPAIYKILNVDRYAENDLFAVLRLCLKALESKQAAIQIFDQNLTHDRCLFIDMNNQPEQSVTIIENNLKVLNNYQNRQCVVNDSQNEAIETTETAYRAWMQSLIVFDQQPLGIVTFYDEQLHAWNERELTILTIIADVLAPYIYYGSHE